MAWRTYDLFSRSAIAIDCEQGDGLGVTTADDADGEEEGETDGIGVAGAEAESVADADGLGENVTETGGVADADVAPDKLGDTEPSVETA